MSKLPLVVYFSSRNNYNMMEDYTLKHFPIDRLHMLNVDDSSDAVEKEKGKVMCKRHGIPYVDNPHRGMQWSLKTAIDYAREEVPECKWVVHFQHDNHPIKDDFFDSLFQYIDTTNVARFGTLGFNHVSPKGEQTGNLIKRVIQGKNGIGMVGMSPLTNVPKNGYWYNGAVFDMSWNDWGTPFAVEVVPMMGLAFNMDLFDKYIDITDQYHLQFWSYDICLQFCKHNVFNVCLPEMYALNDMKSKLKYDMHWNSPKANDPRHFGDYGPHFKLFIKRWGWDWQKRSDFKKVLSRYKGTLLEKFFRHEAAHGPLERFEDIKL